MTADRASLRVARENLVENAAEHGGDASTVAVRVERSAAGAVVHVEDDGPGIPVLVLDTLAAGWETPCSTARGWTAG